MEPDRSTARTIAATTRISVERPAAFFSGVHVVLVDRGWTKARKQLDIWLRAIHQSGGQCSIVREGDVLPSGATHVVAQSWDKVLLQFPPPSGPGSPPPSPQPAAAMATAQLKHGDGSKLVSVASDS